MRLLSLGKLRAALQIAVVALFFYAGTAYPETRLSCHDLKKQLSELFIGGYAWLAQATADNGLIIQIFINQKTSEFVLLGVDDKENACYLLRGSEFFLLAGEPI
jgi:hypothetical protein